MGRHNILKAIREARGLSQMELGALLGRFHTSVSLLELRDMDRVQYGTLERVARALGVDPQDILRLERHRRAALQRGEPVAVTARSAARLLGLGRPTVYQKVAKGRLRAIRLGRWVLIPLAEVERVKGGPVALKPNMEPWPISTLEAVKALVGENEGLTKSGSSAKVKEEVMSDAV